ADGVSAVVEKGKKVAAGIGVLLELIRDAKQRNQESQSEPDETGQPPYTPDVGDEEIVDLVEVAPNKFEVRE
ncbi:hypothetical protein ACFL1M_04930, partial [Patescibacteria group bacterium]